MAEAPTLRSRLYHLKVIIVALVSFILGIALLTLAKYVNGRQGWAWLSFWPIGEIGGTLTAAGMFGIAWDYADARDRDEREDERIRRLLKEAAPEFRDAVIAGFTETPENMKSVATNETLDKLAANALGVRLGDAGFAAEIYAGLLAQAIRTPERWYDVDVSIRLSRSDHAGADPGRGALARDGRVLLDVLVTWEYTVTPSHAVQRFACTSDMAEFHELLEDVPATSTWFMTPRPGVDASSASSYELIDFSVDGKPRRIRRSARKSGQIYSVTIGEEIVAAEQPVRVRHTYRAVADPANHRLFLAISQPAHSVHVDIDYSAAAISRMSVTDLLGSSGRPYVSQLPAQAAGGELTIEVPGWVQAGTGFTFVWTLDSEETSSNPTPARTAA